MAVFYCHYCDLHIDLDYDSDHYTLVGQDGKVIEGDRNNVGRDEQLAFDSKGEVIGHPFCAHDENCNVYDEKPCSCDVEYGFYPSDSLSRPGILHPSDPEE